MKELVKELPAENVHLLKSFLSLFKTVLNSEKYRVCDATLLGLANSFAPLFCKRTELTPDSQFSLKGFQTLIAQQDAIFAEEPEQLDPNRPPEPQQQNAQVLQQQSIVNQQQSVVNQQQSVVNQQQPGIIPPIIPSDQQPSNIQQDLQPGMINQQQTVMPTSEQVMSQQQEDKGSASLTKLKLLELRAKSLSKSIEGSPRSQTPVSQDNDELSYESTPDRSNRSTSRLIVENEKRSSERRSSGRTTQSVFKRLKTMKDRTKKARPIEDEEDDYFEEEDKPQRRSKRKQQEEEMKYDFFAEVSKEDPNMSDTQDYKVLTPCKKTGIRFGSSIRRGSGYKNLSKSELDDDPNLLESRMRSRSFSTPEEYLLHQKTIQQLKKLTAQEQQTGMDPQFSGSSYQQPQTVFRTPPQRQHVFPQQTVPILHPQQSVQQYPQQNVQQSIPQTMDQFPQYQQSSPNLDVLKHIQQNEQAQKELSKRMDTISTELEQLKKLFTEQDTKTGQQFQSMLRKLNELSVKLSPQKNQGVKSSELEAQIEEKITQILRPFTKSNVKLKSDMYTCKHEINTVAKTLLGMQDRLVQIEQDHMRLNSQMEIFVKEKKLEEKRTTYLDKELKSIYETVESTTSRLMETRAELNLLKNRFEALYRQTSPIRYSPQRNVTPLQHNKPNPKNLGYPTSRDYAQALRELNAEIDMYETQRQHDYIKMPAMREQRERLTSPPQKRV